MTKRTVSLLPIVMLILPVFARGENIRGPIVDHVLLDSTSGAHQATLGLEDLLAVSIANNGRFIKGVELDLTIPPAARQYRNLLGIFVYKKIVPAPTADSTSYTGSRADFAVLPASAKAYVNIPLKPNAIQSSAETITLNHPIPAAEFPLIVTILPVAKGIPASVSDSRFTLKISPILEDKGLAKVKFDEGDKPPQFSFTVSIDDHQVEEDPAGYELASGIHHLSITSDHYKEVNKTFGIDKGQTTYLDITLERLVPTIMFEAPETSEIFLDGQKLDAVPKKPLQVTEGDHTVIIRIGNYSLTKKFSVERGKSYKVSLFLDILVQEN